MNEKELNIYSQKKKEFLSFLKKKPFKGLYNPINYIFSNEGKNIRPFFIILIYQYYGGRNSSINSVALAVQALHNFTLIHDDIMDDSKLRRGELTVHRKWDINTAILSGDALMIYSYQILMSVKFKNDKKLLDFFTETVIQICEGQQLDMDFQKKEKVEINDYLNMINLKTGALFAFSFSVGPLLLDRDKEEKKMYDLGILLGQLFQIQDDYLDLFGSKKVGKQIGLDILNKKKTYLILSFYRLASPKHLQDFKKLLYSKNKQEENILKIIDLFNVYNIKEIVTSKLKKIVDNINSIIDNLAFSDSRKKQLKNYIKLLSERDK